MGDGSALSIAQRLELALSFVPRSEWQSAFGRSEKQLRRYLDGSDVPLSVLTTIASGTGVPPEWLVTGRPSAGVGDRAEGEYQPKDAPAAVRQGQTVAEGTRKIIEVREFERSDRNGKPFVLMSRITRQASLPGYVAISRQNVAALEGLAQLVDHPQVVECIAFQDEFVRSQLRRLPDELLLVQANGDAMEPTIPNGAILTVDINPARKLEHRAIYVLRIGDELLARRLEVRPDRSVALSRDNPTYATASDEPFAAFQLLGEVILVLASPK